MRSTAQFWGVFGVKNVKSETLPVLRINCAHNTAQISPKRVGWELTAQNAAFNSGLVYDQWLWMIRHLP